MTTTKIEDLATPPPPYEDINAWVRYYRKFWGINTFPAPTQDKGKEKKDCRFSWIYWQKYKSEPISDEQQEQWIQNGEYTWRHGIGLIPGKVWFGPNKGRWLIAADADNRLGIDVICELFDCSSTSLEELAAKGVVIEQHVEDEPDKAHFYFYSDSPFQNLPGVKTRQAGNPEIDRLVKENKIPANEIKADGGCQFPTPSIHVGGFRYRQMAGSPALPTLCLTEAEVAEKTYKLEEILNRYGSSIISSSSSTSSGIAVFEMLKPGYKVTAGNNRHGDCLKIGDSYLRKYWHEGKKAREAKALDETLRWNHEHCAPPISDAEAEEQFFRRSVPYIERKIKEEESRTITVIDANNTTTTTATTEEEEEEEEEEENSDNDASDGDEKNDEEEKKRTAKAKKALELAIANSKELFLNEFGRAFAAMKVNDHVEVQPMEERRFKNWISGIYYKECNDLLADDDLRKIVRILTAKAEFDPTVPRRSLDVRVRGYSKKQEEGEEAEQLIENGGGNGHDDYAVSNVSNVWRNGEIVEDFDAIYYDLTNPKWEAIKITTEGWEIDKQPPILFRRFGGELPQLYPDRNYDEPTTVLDEFLDLINLKPDRKEEQKKVLKPDIITMFYPNTIPKPIWILPAAQGSAKTTTFELMRDLVDPNSTLTMSLPKEDVNLKQSLAHNYTSFYDNVSDVKDWQSDVLCRAVTGAGDMKRKLFENDEDIIYKYKRIIGLNGITNVITKADLLDRGIYVEFGEIAREDRKLLRIIWRKYLKLKPKLLAFCFDVISEVMKERQKWKDVDNDYFGLEDVIKQKGGLPRMADWAILAEQVSAILSKKEGKPYKPGDFLEAFDKNLEILNTEALKVSLVAEGLIAFMTDKEVRGLGKDKDRYGNDLPHWEGSATHLLGDLSEFIQSNPDLKIDTKSRSWVHDPAVLGKEIAGIAPNLRALGIIIDSHRTEKNVIYTITKLPTLPTVPTGGDNSRSNEGQNPVGSDVGKPTGLPTAEEGENHAQNDMAVGNVGNVGKIEKSEGFPSFVADREVSEAIQKASLDSQGNYKGYLTKDDFVYTGIMEPNWHCTEDQAEQTFYALLEEGKIVEIEPGKYKPIWLEEKGE